MKSGKNLLFYIFAISILIMLAYSCATIVPPSGGEKDITPPKLVSSIPANHSTGFKGNRLVLTFNEYVQLKDMDKNLLVSPPMSTLPEMKIKGHSVIVRLKDTLRANTTYSFYFGDGIVDLTEQNPLKNFSLAFATGDVIDSLSLGGSVNDAFTRAPVKDAIVMMYENLADSAPMLDYPKYVSRTDESGSFLLGNLAGGSYRLIALKDADNDYKYNLPNEQIAFNDSLVVPVYTAPVVNDTGVTIITPPATSIYTLRMFPEPDSMQRLLKGSMVTAHQMQFVFRYPTTEPVLEPLNFTGENWCINEFSPNRDTLSTWLLGTLPDSIKLKISDLGSVIDTLEASLQFKVKTTGRKNQEPDSTLKFQSVTSKSGKLDWGSDYRLTFANPLTSFDPGLVRLIIAGAPDTLSPGLEYADSIHRRLRVIHPWKTGEDYSLLFYKGAFRDIYGQVNDSVKSSFKLNPKDEYGILRIGLKLNNITHPKIIQLLTEKGVVIKQLTVQSSQKLDFGYLSPGKYNLRAIYDDNGNGKWDTGVFIRKIQPERTSMHPKTFEVRGNWELEEEWEL